jgi:hypothetical protein
MVPDGCTSSTACNYNPAAVCDDGSCDFGSWYLPVDYSPAGMPAVQACTPPAGYFLAEDVSCLEQIIAADPYCIDTDWDQICQDAYLACCAAPGCTDPAACNYDSMATCNDGSCLTLDACGNCGGNATAGCMDSNACNYEPSASCSDGSCTNPGCTNISACNYDSLAGCDDGSCEYLTCRGCVSISACNYDPSASIDDGSCEYASCTGCTNTDACNYDPSTTIDDGSCELGLWYIPEVLSVDPALLACSSPVGYTLANQDCIESVIAADPFCLNNNWDALCMSSYNCCLFGGACTDVNACNYANTMLCPGDVSLCEYAGCDDPTACNYDPAAACSDGSCDYACYGCMSAVACNYDSSATIEDGSCEFTSCAIFGCTYTDATNYDSTATEDDMSCLFDSASLCPYDFTDDGLVNTQDLLLFLGAFGSTCP